MKIHKMNPADRLDLTYKAVDVKGRLPNVDSIEFLRVEEPYHNGHRYGPFARVRYALDGVEQVDGLPLDISKGIFLSIYDDELREKLHPIAPMIVKILQEHAAKEPIENFKKANQQGVHKGAKESTIESILEALELRFRPNSMPDLKPILSGIDDLQRLKQLRRTAMQAQTLEEFINTLSDESL